MTYGGGCQSGQASWYACSGSGACAACNPSEYMAAHVTLPCGTAVTVTDTANGRSVKVIYKNQRKDKKYPKGKKKPKRKKRMVRVLWIWWPVTPRSTWRPTSLFLVELP
jgi:hypothetical protein